MSITLARPNGDIRISESEIFATPQPLGELVAQFEETRIYRVRQREEFHYRVTGLTEFQPDVKKLILVLSGPGFTGGAPDAVIYNRFGIGDVGKVHCDQQYLYGWEFFLADDE